MVNPVLARARSWKRITAGAFSLAKARNLKFTGIS